MCLGDAEQGGDVETAYASGEGSGRPAARLIEPPIGSAIQTAGARRSKIEEREQQALRRGKSSGGPAGRAPSRASSMFWM